MLFYAQICKSRRNEVGTPAGKVNAVQSQIDVIADFTARFRLIGIHTVIAAALIIAAQPLFFDKAVNAEFRHIHLKTVVQNFGDDPFVNARSIAGKFFGKITQFHPVAGGEIGVVVDLLLTGAPQRGPFNGAAVAGADTAIAVPQLLMYDQIGVAADGAGEVALLLLLFFCLYSSK